MSKKGVTTIFLGKKYRYNQQIRCYCVLKILIVLKLFEILDP